ncbi:MAG: hypothetical protein ACXABY_13605, partial [Candidatus Thorarchaeota archaeon]
FKGYMWAVEQILGIQPVGYRINCLLNRKPTKTGKGIDFMRDLIYMKWEQVEEWKNDTIAIIEDFVAHFLRAQYPMHTQWCKGKYGKCEYFDVCTLPPSQRHMMLDSPNYRTWTWDPIDQEEQVAGALNKSISDII